MDIGDIIGDAIKYPVQDLKKFIIFVVIVIISMILSGRVGLIGSIIGLIVSFIASGYMLRTIKASIAGSDELPEFNEWGEMIIEGLKVFLVYLIYFIPAIIIMIVLAAPAITAAAYLSTGISIEGISGLIGLAFVGIIVSAIYAIFIGGPLSILGIANMAYYDGEFSAAFRFSEIRDHISRIGLTDFIIWYIVMIISGIVAAIIGIILLGVGLFITLPYYYLYFTRSLALMFTATEQPISEAEAVSPGK